MKKLHLIVHKSMLEEEIKSDLTPKEKLPKLESVLKRIQEIEITEENVKHIAYDRDNPSLLYGILHVTDVCQDHHKIILYGISLSVCLPYAKHTLEKKGFDVIYDERGTID